MSSAGSDGAGEAARRPVRALLWGALPLLLIVGMGVPFGLAAIAAASETLEECTVESIRTVDPIGRRSHSYLRVSTAECGDLRSSREMLQRLEDENCPGNTIAIGSRYRMTITGVEGLLGLFPRTLAAKPELVQAGAGAGCTSDHWLVDDE